eukprot:4593924-Heterocapsa_arctica.AAC.1
MPKDVRDEVGPRLMSDGRHRVVVLGLEASSNLTLVDFRGMTADCAHVVDRKHGALSADVTTRGDKDGHLEPALVIVDASTELEIDVVQRGEDMSVTVTSTNDILRLSPPSAVRDAGIVAVRAAARVPKQLGQ